jgi:hypothetical protein
MMAHPGFRPAKVSTTPYESTPQVFPPVTVNNEDEEEYHAAQGYVPAGKGDPSAYAMAHASPPPDNYEPQEYPKWVNGVLFNTKQDEDAHEWPSQAAPEPAHEPVDYEAQIAALTAQLAAAQAPKNRGGRPRKQPAA